MKKQLAVLSMVVALGMLLAGCGSDATKNSSSKANQGAAKNYPNKTVQIVVPYGAGGDTDTNARVMSKYLSKELGKPVIVTNVAGSSGVVGSQQVLDSKPDGYTVLFNHPTMLMNNLIGLTDISWKNFKNAGIGLLMTPMFLWFPVILNIKICKTSLMMQKQILERFALLLLLGRLRTCNCLHLNN